MGSIQDVANLAGLSVATVSRVYNQRPNVTAEARKAVLKAAQEVGYDPKVSARKEAILLVIDSFEHLNQGGYGAMLTAAMTTEIIRRNLRLEMLPVSELDILQKKFLKGIVSIAYQDDSVDLLSSISGLPVIFVNHQVQGKFSVFSNIAAGMKSVCDHLWEHGHRKIGFIQPNANAWCAREREQQMHSSHAGLEVISVVGPASDLNLIAQLVKVSGVSAIFCAGEESGPALMYALQLLSLRVPEDISVVCYEYNGITEYLGKGCTALKQDFQALSHQSLELLLAPSPLTEHVAVDHHWIQRHSVKTLPSV